MLSFPLISIVHVSVCSELCCRETSAWQNEHWASRLSLRSCCLWHWTTEYLLSTLRGTAAARTGWISSNCTTFQTLILPRFLLWSRFVCVIGTCGVEGRFKCLRVMLRLLHWTRKKNPSWLFGECLRAGHFTQSSARKWRYRCTQLWFRQPDSLLLHIDDDVGPAALRSTTETPRNS